MAPTASGLSVLGLGRRQKALFDAAWAPRVLGKHIKLSKSGLTYPVAQGTLVCSPMRPFAQLVSSIGSADCVPRRHLDPRTNRSATPRSVKLFPLPQRTVYHVCRCMSRTTSTYGIYAVGFCLVSCCSFCIRLSVSTLGVKGPHPLLVCPRLVPGLVRPRYRPFERTGYR